ncbi:uncharacterized protein J3D65DRAFT_669543 [Phyllosticta citribraziliensis]|uniref:Uncharacterized protein n=1 Tax=Phyllosticta citribraziliensis TaxID=989973 RepID=A0ABR1LGK9_9PEZI
MEAPRPTSSVYSRDEDGNSISPAEQFQVQPVSSVADQLLQSVVRTVKRLLWADGFQAQILEVIEALNQMHGLLRNGLIEETLQKIESLSKKVVDILTAWTRRNQRISVDARLMREANISAVSQLDPNTRIQPLPTITGCEVNVEAIQGMRSFFVDSVVNLCSAAKHAGHGSAHSTPTEIRVINCLLATRDRLEDVAFSTEQASKDVAASWKAISERSLYLASRASQEVNKRAKEKQRIGKFTFKNLFSKRNSRKDDIVQDDSGRKANTDSPAKASESAPHDAAQRRYPPGMFYADAFSPLSALPPTSLVNLEAQHETTQQAVPEERHDSVSVASHNGEHHSVNLGRPGVLSELERNINRVFVQRLEAKRAESPEASGTRSWWRERALQDLEGQEPDEDSEWEWEDCEEEEEEEGGEESSEEEAAEKKARDVAEALEMLEALGGVANEGGDLGFCFVLVGTEEEL